MIARTLTQVAKATACFERPQDVGHNPTGTVTTASDFDDCFLQVILGTHPDGYLVVPGDYLRFEIMALTSAAATMRFGVDVKFIGGAWLSDAPTLDAAGHSSADADRSSGVGAWYQAAVSLEEFAGNRVDQLVLYSEEDDAGVYEFDVRAIVVVNGDAVQKVYWNGASYGIPAAVKGIFRSGYFPSFTLNLIDLGVGGTVGSPIVVGTGTSYSVPSSALAIFNNSATGAMTFNLPDLATLPVGKTYLIRNMQATYNLTIDPYSAQQINGPSGNVSTLTLTPHQSVQLISIGGSWQALGPY